MSQLANLNTRFAIALIVALIAVVLPLPGLTGGAAQAQPILRAKMQATVAVNPEPWQPVSSLVAAPGRSALDLGILPGVKALTVAPVDLTIELGVPAPSLPGLPMPNLPIPVFITP